MPFLTRPPLENLFLTLNSILSGPTKILVLDKDPKENKEYLDLKDPTSTEGSFKKGGLVRQGKPKLAKKGWR